jgi:hypothetical protein
MKALILFLVSFNLYAQFIPLEPLPPADGTLTQKGSLFTSTGSLQAVFDACADNEIIVWDSTELKGFKCEAKPSGSSFLVNDTLYTPPLTFGSVSIAGASGTMTQLSTSFTATDSKPIMFMFNGYVMARRLAGGSETDTTASCQLKLNANGVEVAMTLCSMEGRTSSAGWLTIRCPLSSMIHRDVTSGVTYNYTLTYESDGTCTMGGSSNEGLYTYIKHF